MDFIVDLKTFVKEKGVWVSTVAHKIEIGMGRTSETMVFKGNEKEITNWLEVYFESHGYETREALLKKEHERIVNGIREGTINLSEEEK